MADLSAGEKNLLIHGHAASVFEDWCRSRFPGAGRYREKHLEIDLVCPDPDTPGRLLVGEAKWSHLTKADRQKVLRDLQAKWNGRALAPAHPDVRFKVFDASGIG